MSRGRMLPGILLACAFLAVAVGLQASRASLPSVPPADQFLDVQSGTAMRRLTLSFNLLAADVYWIRALQHYGGTKLDARSDKSYPLLYPLLDITTSLDPRFNLAYRFGSIFLAEPFPNGPGRPDLAIRLLEKGLHTQPRKWEYMQDIGFVYYWWHHDDRTAARWFEQAAAVPGAPWFLKSLAATTLTIGGQAQASRLMWQQIYQTANNDWLKKDAAWRLQQLTAIDQMDRLQKLLDAARGSSGDVPSWGDLLQRRLLPGIPIDPSGTPYEIDQATGAVELSRRSSLWPLPAETALPAVHSAPGGSGGPGPEARGPRS
ncbi:MAG TPA: hypothetical protein VIC33_02405 [Vicinamibacterales bacterium]